MATEAKVTAVIEAQDKASSVLNSITSGFSNFSLAGIAASAAVATVAVGLQQFISASISAAATMEQNTVAFTTMLGSAEKANTLIRELTNFAKTTPFELSNLNQATKQLLAYGIAQEDIIPTLTSLGNIAAGVGMDKMPNLILAFGQVKAATRLTGMELRQFTEAGVPLLDMLSQQFKKPVAEIQKMVSEGQVGFPAVQKALAALSGEGGRFNNLMEKQSHTLTGMISNLQDAWNIFLMGAGAHFLDWAKQVVGLGTSILQWLGNLGPNLSDLAIRLDATTGILSVFKFQWDNIVRTFQESLMPAIRQLWEAIKPLEPFFRQFGVFLAGTFIITLTALAMALAGIIQDVTLLLSAVMPLATFIADVLNFAFKQSVEIVSDLIIQIQKLISWIGKIPGVGAVGKAISGAVGAVGKLLSFDTGGIVPGAVGAPQLAIVHGGERVVPVGGQPGGITVNITGNSIANSVDMRELASRVGDEVMRSLRQAQQI